MTLLHGNNLDLLRAMPDNSVHSIVCDPPYGLGKEPDALAMLRDWIETGHHDVKSKSGFMGKTWDAFVPQPVQWRECLRVLKPGGHLLAFAGTRTQDLVALGLRLAGFEIRDLVAWVYGQGFPKSANVGCRCEGGALPYTHEEKLPRKPKTERDLHPVRGTDVSPPVGSGERRGQVLQSGVSEPGAPVAGRAKLSSSKIWQRQPSMEGRCDLLEEARELQTDQICSVSSRVSADGEEGRLHHGASPDNGADDGAVPDTGGGCPSSEPQSSRQQPGELRAIPEQRGTQEGGRSACPTCKGIIGAEGFGTALKPALEPITLARKPLEGTVAANVLKWHTGALNVDGCRVTTTENLNGGAYAKEGGRGESQSLHGGSGMNQAGKTVGTDFKQPEGRWPANLIHDGSDDVTGLFPDTTSGKLGPVKTPKQNQIFGKFAVANVNNFEANSGSAARFFYAAKVSAKEREGSVHPTMKPIALMRYLCRLITPPGGTVLDPWMGSGSTGKAAKLEGFDFIGMEQDAGYFAIAQARCGVTPEVVEIDPYEL